MVLGVLFSELATRRRKEGEEGGFEESEFDVIGEVDENEAEYK